MSKTKKTKNEIMIKNGGHNYSSDDVFNFNSFHCNSLRECSVFKLNHFTSDPLQFLMQVQASPVRRYRDAFRTIKMSDLGV